MPELAAGLTYDGSAKAALAILTTDTYIKECAVQFEAGGKTCTLGGIAKGSGMIHINMGTMLSFISTDCAVSQAMLDKALHEEIIDSYNQVSVDGDTSTNDTVVLMSNGMAGNEEITGEGKDYEIFCEALHIVSVELSKMIAGDGEGATALFEVIVKGAASKEDAVKLSKSVVGSSLTKAAIYGHDANCGRIMCALGYAGVPFDPEKVDLTIESRAGSVKVVEDGVFTAFDEEKAARILSENHVTAIADMKAGDAMATAWGCDLTHEYVTINADYRS